ncbi:MAG: DUF4350 domain-containing protein [Actinomycetia bacterium]|nr:DUF4350 domain-containing protein [Actinomycetes bacterium]
MSRSAVGVVMAVVVIVVGAAVLWGRDDGRVAGPPLDPRSTIGSGTRAAWLLAEDVGRDVSVGQFDDRRAVTVLVDPEVMEDVEVDQIREYVESGGTVVLLEPDDRLVELADVDVIDGEVHCAVEPLAGVANLTIGVVQGIGAPAGSQHCFAVGDGWLVVSAEAGEGRIVAVGSARPFTNQWLAEDDHAALVVGVLALTDGPIRVVATSRVGAIGEGGRDLMDLVSPVVWALVAMVVVVAAAFTLSRGRRLGAPVLESDAVEIDATELTRATARLYERTDATAVGAARMSTLVRSDLARRWRISTDETDAASIAARVRAGHDQVDVVIEALGTNRPDDDDAYVRRIAAAVEARRVITGATRTSAGDKASKRRTT